MAYICEQMWLLRFALVLLSNRLKDFFLISVSVCQMSSISVWLVSVSLYVGRPFTQFMHSCLLGFLAYASCHKNILGSRTTLALGG